MYVCMFVYCRMKYARLPWLFQTCLACWVVTIGSDVDVRCRGVFVVCEAEAGVGVCK